ncbi:hypothetical protein P171DRAFT_291777 [Karstenula rhodostoma CBS 690.94]|uniref:Heterokaryon incompatibility domain-containing protein n=1 Tax=Karstenula rhodostoma CBS 690.94 TaxID=1392251 RepID=A0A9P4UDJ2_9PLEO|nr:hypothetical protein P171DRAFT_291777 [Karstenula rhodostoma CBS 690.94]
MRHLIDNSGRLWYDESTSEDLHRLLNVTYWTRIWIVQEIVLARQWFVMCNEQILDGECLIKFCRKAYASRTSVLLSRAFKIVEERVLFRIYGASTLVHLLCRFLDLASTYPVDKIRTLLALCSDDTENLDRILHPLADNFRQFGLHPKDKSEICDEIVRLAAQSDLRSSPWALVGCRDLVTGVLGVNLPHLAAQLGTLFGRRDTGWVDRSTRSEIGQRLKSLT